MVCFVNVACGNSSFVLTFPPPFPLRIFFAQVMSSWRKTLPSPGQTVIKWIQRPWLVEKVLCHCWRNVLLLRRTKIYWGGKQRVGYHRVLELIQVLTSFSAKTFTLRMTWTSCSTKWIFQRGARNLFRYKLQCQHSTSQLFPPLLFSVHFL